MTLHSNPILLASIAIAIAARCAFSNKKKKTELEKNSIAAPIPFHLLPYQIDSIIYRTGKILLGYSELEILREVCNKYGNTVNFRGLNQDFYLLADPACIQHILVKNWKNYEKGKELYKIFHESFGSGIFNSDGDIWKNQRQIARPHFQTSEFKDAILINKHADHLINVINERLASSNDNAIEVQDLFYRFSLDASAEFLFGETVNSLESDNSSFTRAFNYTLMIMGWRLRTPKWEYFVPKSRYLQEIKVLDDFVLKIIDNAIERHEKNKRNNRINKTSDGDEIKERHENLLDHFLNSQEKENKIFSRKYLRDMVMNFMLAGRDSTGTLLTFTLWCLSQHPNVLERVVKEIDEVVGPSRVPKFEDIKKLKYQKQVINEVLRLYPPLPLDPRISIEEDVLPNGVYVPPRTRISYSAYITHRLPEYWGEDSLIFDPERWGPERVQSIKPFMFIPFHAGPRICLGQNLSYTSTMVTLTRLLQVYNIKAKPGFNAVPSVNVVLFFPNGVQLILEPRMAC